MNGIVAVLGQVLSLSQRSGFVIHLATSNDQVLTGEDPVLRRSKIWVVNASGAARRPPEVFRRPARGLTSRAYLQNWMSRRFRIRFPSKMRTLGILKFLKNLNGRLGNRYSAIR